MGRFDGDTLLELAKRNDLLDDPETRTLVLAAALSESEQLQASSAQALVGKSLQNWRYPFSSNSINGGVDLGATFDAEPYSLHQEDLMKHLLAVGQSGSGKTTLFYNLSRQLDVPVWFFDLKQDYRHLMQDVEPVVLPWTTLKLNPLKPPEGATPRRWAQVFSEIFGHSTALLSGSKNYLLKKVIQLYQAYGLFEDVSSPYPSLHELQLLIETDSMNYAQKSANYRDTVLNRLEAMNLVAGTVFDCSRGYSIEELLERDAVFEFDGLSRDVQNFLMEILFASVYEYRLGQNHRGSGLNHVFLLDEGKRVFSVYKERQDASGIPEIDDLTAKMREFGEGLLVADQEASKLTDSIKANTYTKVLLPTGDRKQLEAVATSMNLSQRQMEFAQKLGDGEAIIQVGNRDPVAVKLDNYSVEKQVTDSELESRMAECWNSLSSEPRETTPEFNQIIGQHSTEDAEEVSFPEDPQAPVDTSDEADRLIEDVIENPFKPLTDRYSQFSSSYKGNKAKNELVDDGLLIERSVRTQDGKRKLLEFTDKGRDYVEDTLDLDVQRSGRGGVVHRFWQHRIKTVFEERGWAAELEMFDADVYVNLNDSELVIEVAMGNNQRELEHVKKHIDSEFDSIWVVCRTQGVMDGLKQRMAENRLEDDRLLFRLFRDFNDAEQLPG